MSKVEAPQQYAPPVPEASVLEVLTEGDISGPFSLVQTHQEVDAGVVENGPGMLGIEFAPDSKKRTGINTHVLLTTVYTLYYAEKLRDAGAAIDPQSIATGMIGSHPGRIYWEDGRDFPEVVSNPEYRRSKSNEVLGMEFMEGKIPEKAFNLIVSLGHNVEGFSVDPSVYNNWEHRLSIYVDHRTTQQYLPLNERMGDFLVRNFFAKNEDSPELRAQVYTKIDEIIQKQKNYVLGNSDESISLEDADAMIGELGSNNTSDRVSTRRTFLQLVLNDAETEARLIQMGINPDEINTDTFVMPRWAKYLGRLYLNDAEADTFKRIEELNRLRDAGIITQGDIDKQFPAITPEMHPNERRTWGVYMRTLYETQKGKPATWEKGGGISRAIKQFRRLDRLRETQVFPEGKVSS